MKNTDMKGQEFQEVYQIGHVVGYTCLYLVIGFCAYILEYACEMEGFPKGFLPVAHIVANILFYGDCVAITAHAVTHVVVKLIECAAEIKDVFKKHFM